MNELQVYEVRIEDRATGQCRCGKLVPQAPASQAGVPRERS